MNKTTAGWVTFIAALGMMCGLLSADVATLKSWHDAFTPAFVALFMSHFAAVVMAFMGGKMIPESRDSQLTRSTDKQP